MSNAVASCHWLEVTGDVYMEPAVDYPVFQNAIELRSFLAVNSNWTNEDLEDANAGFKFSLLDVLEYLETYVDSIHADATPGYNLEINTEAYERSVFNSAVSFIRNKVAQWLWIANQNIPFPAQTSGVKKIQFHYIASRYDASSDYTVQEVPECLESIIESETLNMETLTYELYCNFYVKIPVAQSLEDELKQKLSQTHTIAVELDEVLNKTRE